MRTLAPLFLLSLVACRYEEEIPEKDLFGKVIVPRAAATQQPILADGTLGEAVTDPRFIGPVYLGAFAAIDTAAFPYPHPSMGPVITSAYPGNTFPYGGTTIGRFEFGCFESIACRVTTGRFKDYADVLDYFANLLGDPVTDSRGEVVDSASTMQQACFQYHRATSDSEIAFVGEDNLNFEENEDGDFVASFRMPHTIFEDDMVLWGWVDTPRISVAAGDVDGQFSTCDGSQGRQVNTYDQSYFQGRTQYDLLNFPSLYVYEGDFVADGSTVVTSPDEELTVRINIPVTETE